MSNVSSIRNGEWFQDLYGWSRVLDLGHRESLARVQLEAKGAKHVDDVIAWPADAAHPVEYVQLKFHVGGESGRYSVNKLMELPAATRRTAARGRKPRGTSLLQKLFMSWQTLRDTGQPVRLILFSNWSWEDGDPLRSLLSGRDDRLGDVFFNAPATEPVGEARELWRGHVNADAKEFETFIRAMHFRVGRGSIQQLEELVATRMRDRGFHADAHAVDRAVGQIGKWIREGTEEITPAMYARAVVDLQLPLPEADPAIRVCLQTIEPQAYPESADHTIDWCEHFVPSTDEAPFPRGHRLNDASAWQAVLLPELRALKAALNATAIRLLRVRGQARLSTWIGFGHVFDGRSRYVLELEQNGQVWRTDATPALNRTFLTVIQHRADAGPEIALALAITNPVLPAVQRAIGVLTLPVGTLIAIEPCGGASRYAVDSAQTMATMVEEVRRALGDSVATSGAVRIHLFYAGPLALGAALGHGLGASAPELQLYEYDNANGYLPSFLLRG